MGRSDHRRSATGRNLDRLVRATEGIRPNVVAGGTAHQPMRGDDVEAWLRQWRNRYGAQATLADGDRYRTIDMMLDEYREKADYGLRLDEDGGDP